MQGDTCTRLHGERDLIHGRVCAQGKTPKFVLSCADKGSEEQQHLLLIQRLAARYQPKKSSVGVSYFPQLLLDLKTHSNFSTTV